MINVCIYFSLAWNLLFRGTELATAKQVMTELVLKGMCSFWDRYEERKEIWRWNDEFEAEICGHVLECDFMNSDFMQVIMGLMDYF